MTKPHHPQGEYAEGDEVVYHPTGAANTSVGIIKRVITEPEAVGGRQTVKASEDEPRYVPPKNITNCIPYPFLQVIENEHTGKETAYKYESIVEKTRTYEK